MSAAVAIESEEHWHSLRAQNLGGSEVPALFGAHASLTAFELWHIKRGNIPAPDLSDNDRVFWGQTLEPAVAMGVAKRTGWNIRKVRRYLRHSTVAGLGASIDYEIVANDRGPGVLEIKCADWLVFRRWEDGEPPLAYQLQLQTYLAVTGREWGAIAVLIGGNDLKLFEYERRPKTIARIEAAVEAFWRSIAEDRPPKPDFDGDAETIAALHGEATAGKVVDLSTSNRLPELIAEYQRASAAAKEAEAAKKAAKAEILELIGDAETVLCGASKITARAVAGGPVSYERQPYRDFRIHTRKD